MQAVKTIVLANYREFGMPVDRFLDAHELAEWRQEDIDYESTGLFWDADEKLVITSRPIMTDFIEDVCRLMKYHALRVLWPNNPDDALCDVILREDWLFNELVETIRISDKPRLLVWGISDGLYRLTAALERLGLAFSVPDVPPAEAAWTCQRFGSKSGFRQFGEAISQRHPIVRIPPGQICQDLAEALQAARRFVETGRPFLLKTDQGAAGWGTVVFNPSSQLDHPSQDQQEKLRSGIWRNGPVIVEEFIESYFRPSEEQHYPLTPTVDAWITAQGQVDFQFTGNMIIEDLTQYHGVALGRGVLPDAVDAQLREIIQIVGTAMAKEGYRGWFDIDLVCDEQQNLYANEINARRTSPVHAHAILKRLQTLHPAAQAALANDRWQVAAFAGMSYAEVKQCLAPVLYPAAGEGRGLLISVPGTLAYGQGQVGFVIVGQDFADVMALKRQAEALANFAAGKGNDK